MEEEETSEIKNSKPVNHVNIKILSIIVFAL